MHSPDAAAAKIAVFKECGIECAVTPSDMADALVRCFSSIFSPSVPRSIMKKLLLVLLVSAVTCAGSITSTPSLSNVVDLRWLDTAIARTDTLTVFEGLPHQTFEPKERVAEIARVPTFEIGDQSFYLRTLEISATDRQKLVEIFVPQRMVVPPPVAGLPMKFCGGFHADYAFRWEKEGEPRLYTLICFGCHEMRIVKESTSVTANMTKEGYEALREILIPYRQERPPFKQLETAERTKLLPPKPEAPKIGYQP